MKQLYYVLRTMKRNLGANIIKVISITLGLTLSILLFTRQAFEFNFDNCYDEYERLYMINLHWTLGGERDAEGSVYCMGPLGGAIADYFPDEVESVAVTRNYWKVPFYNDNVRTNPQTMAVDSTFIHTMGWKLLEGNISDFNVSEVIFVSRSYANELFAGNSPIGKTILYNKVIPMTIKGVYEDFPENSSFYNYDILMTMATHLKNSPNQWRWNGGDSYPTYIRLKNGVDYEKFNQRINDVFITYTLQGDLDEGVKWDVELIPIKDYRIKQYGSEKALIWILILLAFIILFIVTLNYVLISISSLSRRAKSIGVYKCNGAGKGTIMGMFLFETAIILIVSILLMILIFINFKDFFEDMAVTSLKGMFAWSNLWVPACVILFLFIVGGVIPGRIFANIPVTQVFRRYSEGKKSWKRPLLFVQFVGVAFIFSLLVVTIKQTHYIVSVDRGYNMENIASTMTKFENSDNARTTFLNLPYVEDVSSSDWPFSYSLSGMIISTDAGKELSVRYNSISKDYLPFIGVELKEGRLPNSIEDIIVNEELVKDMRWEGSPIGRVIRFTNGSVAGNVVGVIKPIKIQNIVYADPSPLMLFYQEEFIGTIQIKLKEPFEDNLKKLNEEVKTIWPDKDMIFISAMKEMDKQYYSIKVFRNVAIMAALTIIFITLMGLIGYINDETQRRSKEIAIRKVNGAETIDILVMLSKNIAWIALPAVIIGTAIGWFAGMAWLEMFVEATKFPAIYFALIGMLVLTLIIACVVIKAWRIANSNPVNSIKSE